MDSTELLGFLNAHGIRFDCHTHPPVFTSDQARRLIQPLPGASAKNLFLRDRKGRRHFLLTLADTKSLDLKAFSTSLNLAGLSLASPERLMRYLGITPGAVSLLALANDTESTVEVLIDEDIWAADYLQCHPLVNTATLVISLADIRAFLVATRHTPSIIAIPQSGAA